MYHTFVSSLKENVKLLTIFGITFACCTVLFFSIFHITQGESPYVSELAFIEKSYGNLGSVIPASCESGYEHIPGICGPSCVGNVGSACTSAPNSCGMTNSGYVQCDGTCGNASAVGDSGLYWSFPAGHPGSNDSYPGAGIGYYPDTCDGSGNPYMCPAGANGTCIDNWANGTQWSRYVTCRAEYTGATPPSDASCPPPPTLTFTGSPMSILSGQSSTLTWSSANTVSCSGSGFNTGGATNGSVGTGSLTAPTTFTVSCTGLNGQVVTSQVSVFVNQLPLADAGIDRAITQPTSFTIPLGAGASDPEGGVVTVAWDNTVRPPDAPIPIIRNSTTLNPTFTNLTTLGTYVFRLTATDNVGQTASDLMNVVVSDPSAPACVTPPCGGGAGGGGLGISGEIRANGRLGSISIAPGSSVNITWDSNNASSCTVSPRGWTGTENTTGTADTPAVRTVYVLICDGVPVSAVSVDPTTASQPTISVSPRIVPVGQFSRIEWNLNGQTGCTLTTGSGTVLADQNFLTSNSYLDVQVLANTTYNLTCAGGSASATVEIIPIGFET